jgi:glycosyltransferase involved in cell wall biosynthesis
MPAISLVVCLYREGDLLARLLQHAAGCYDDLVVVHDGAEDATAGRSKEAEKQPAINYSDLKTDTPLPGGYRKPDSLPRVGGIHELVKRHGGRYYEGPRAFQQEPHWPFAWWQARHDWILRLDADEFPSDELKQWLQAFRHGPEPAPDVSGYTCIWPLWSGKRATPGKWPDGRIFLINRHRVRFFGMVEQVPVPDGRFTPLELVLHHQPKRKSHGYRNLIFRKQAYHWRHVIALSLLGKPTDLPCWRWSNTDWPPGWREIVERPVRTGFKRLLFTPYAMLRIFLRHRLYKLIYGAPGGGLNHFLICVEVARLKRKRMLVQPAK